MYITKTKSGVNTNYYLVKSFINTQTKKKSSKIVEYLGTQKDIKKKLGSSADIEKWLKDYAKKRTEQEKQKNADININFKVNQYIKRDENYIYNIGYLYLEKICYELDFDKICKKIEKKENLHFNLFWVFTAIIYNKLLEPLSQINTYNFSKRLLRKLNFEKNDVTKALKVISKYNLEIQKHINRTLNSIFDSKPKLFYYDSSNYSITNRYLQASTSGNNIILTKVLFDENSIPRALFLENEDTSFYKDYQSSKNYFTKLYKHIPIYVVPDNPISHIGDNLLSGFDKVNNINTVNLDLVSKDLKKWVKDPKGWHVYYSDDVYNKNHIFKKIKNQNYNIDEHYRYYSQDYYKAKNVYIKLSDNDDVLEKTLVVGYNFECEYIQRNFREQQISAIQQNIERKINSDQVDKLLEHQKNHVYVETLDNYKVKNYYFSDKSLQNKKPFDGYQAICGEHDIEILKGALFCYSSKRGDADYLFTTIKNDFLEDNQTIKKDVLVSHYLMSMMAFIVYKYMQNKVGIKYTDRQLLNSLYVMNFRKIPGHGWLSCYTPNELIDDLNKIFHINLDSNFILDKDMKKIINNY